MPTYVSILNSTGVGSNLVTQYWTPQIPLGGETPNMWLGNRVSAELVNSVGTNANILLPYIGNSGHIDYFLTDAASYFDLSDNDRTIGFWFKSQSLNNPASWEWHFSKSNGSNLGWEIRSNSSGKITFVIWCTGGSGYQWIRSNASVYDTNWHFVLCRVNGTTKHMDMYIDNVKQTEEADYAGNTTTAGATYEVHLGRVASASDYWSQFSYSDIYFYKSLLSPADMTILYNRGHVSGASAHYICFDYNMFYILDVTDNGKHLGQNVMTGSFIGYDKKGSQYPLIKGHTHYKFSGGADIYIPFNDAGTMMVNKPAYAGWSIYNYYEGNLTKHNLYDSYVVMQDAVWDRSNTTIWSSKARGSLYLAGNPTAWHVRELQRFNLYYWANTGYEGLCFVKGIPNSFGASKFLEELFSFDTNKVASDVKKVYKYTNDYEAELVWDGDFSDPNSVSIWYHPYDHFDFTIGKMSYNGTLTTDSGCIRLTSTGLLILGRKYKLKYTIGDIENTYASIEFSGNANFIWDLYPGGFEKKTAGVHEEILTCINDADNFFEIQAGISDLGVDGKFSISNISLKIIE